VPDPKLAHQLRASLSQGDILDNVTISEPSIGSVRAGQVMVLSHCCEIDKPSSQVMIVCPVLPLPSFQGDPNKIRNGDALALFYLADSNGQPERAADLRRTSRVTYSAIGATAFIAVGKDKQRIFSGADPRLSSLTDDGLLALHGRIVGFYTRSRDFEDFLKSAPGNP
jgi:hypothetical protein